MSGNTQRRFIAGAVCPRCSEMDTIFVYREDGIDHRECVSCDFQEQATVQDTPRELPTRVNRPSPNAEAADEVQVVKILDPSEET